MVGEAYCDVISEVHAVQTRNNMASVDYSEDEKGLSDGFLLKDADICRCILEGFVVRQAQCRKMRIWVSEKACDAFRMDLQSFENLKTAQNPEA